MPPSPRSPATPDGPATAARQLLAALCDRPDTYLVGIAGIPGCGKSTLCATVRTLLPDAVVVPMDGYHIPRRLLDEDGLRRRGAADTFDAAAFRTDIESLRRTRQGVFPAFDHAEADPRPAAVRVTPAVPLVLVEGLYVLMRDWRLEPFFDLTVFLDCDPDIATERLATRHLAAGLAATPDLARARAIAIDRVNALAILADACRERAHLVLPS
jgi:pantothenate kinase